MAPAQGDFDDSLFDAEFLRRLQRLRLMAKEARLRGGPGRRASRGLGDGLDLADYRDYAPGDDVRFLDWPYLARMDRLLVRLFHEHSEAEATVVLDCSASMAPGGDAQRFDYARRAAAALLYVAIAGGDRAGLATFADRLSPPRHLGRDESAFPSILKTLAALSPQGPTRLGECLRHIAATSQPGQSILLISDLAQGADQLPAALGLLRARRCEVSVLHVHTPGDARPVLTGAAELLEAETSRRLRLDVGPELLEAYRQRWEARVEGLSRACAARGCAYIPACTDQPFERLVLASLTRAGVVGA